MGCGAAAMTPGIRDMNAPDDTWAEPCQMMRKNLP
jgi:hypothetical protein